MKKIVLSQTCQGLVLKQLLMSSVALKKDFECIFIPNYEIQDGKPGIAPPTALENALEDCDVLIYHDIAPYNFPSLLRRLPTDALTIKIPYITSTIYWPTYSYQTPFGLCPSGTTSLIPWPCLLLNELIATLRDKNKILDAYLETDIPSRLDMLAAYETQLTYLKKAESGSIFRMAEFVAHNFRDIQLFHLINHPSLPVFLEVANAILAHLDLPLVKNFRIDPFATHQIPIHPSIINYYKLSWCDAKTKFKILGKSFNFEEYVSFYIDSYTDEYQYTLFPPMNLEKKVRLGELKRITALFSPRGKNNV